MAAQANGVRVRGYISHVLDCPYEGEVQPGRVSDIAAELLDMVCYEVSLGDTIDPARLCLKSVRANLVEE